LVLLIRRLSLIALRRSIRYGAPSLDRSEMYIPPSALALLAWFIVASSVNVLRVANGSECNGTVSRLGAAWWTTFADTRRVLQVTVYLTVPRSFDMTKYMCIYLELNEIMRDSPSSFKLLIIPTVKKARDLGLLSFM